VEFNTLTDEMIKAWELTIPLRKAGQPEEVANLGALQGAWLAP
jgi:hypothetical protein